MVEIRPRWDWNRTISITSLSLTAFVEIRPRWDWNGISFYELRKIIRKLKSDQDGIEISPPKNKEGGLIHLVEIRPRWDWNCSSVASPFCCVQLKSDQDGIEMWVSSEKSCKRSWLKSDQDGIEIIHLSEWRHDFRGCWNQTKMGLKYSHSLSSPLAFICWNQTKMGLKSYPC